MIIILGHERNVLVNFNNISSIAMTDKGNAIVAIDNDSNTITLGEYESPERTKQVFKDIADAMDRDDFRQFGEIYYMPEK